MNNVFCHFLRGTGGKGVKVEYSIQNVDIQSLN